MCTTYAIAVPAQVLSECHPWRSKVKYQKISYMLYYYPRKEFYQTWLNLMFSSTRQCVEPMLRWLKVKVTLVGQISNNFIPWWIIISPWYWYQNKTTLLILQFNDISSAQFTHTAYRMRGLWLQLTWITPSSCIALVIEDPLQCVRLQVCMLSTGIN
jgi:hypothetical protein